MKGTVSVKIKGFTELQCSTCKPTRTSWEFVGDGYTNLVWLVLKNSNYRFESSENILHHYVRPHSHRHITMPTRRKHAVTRVVETCANAEENDGSNQHAACPMNTLANSMMRNKLLQVILGILVLFAAQRWYAARGKVLAVVVDPEYTYRVRQCSPQTEFFDSWPFYSESNYVFEVYRGRQCMGLVSFHWSSIYYDAAKIVPERIPPYRVNFYIGYKASASTDDMRNIICHFDPNHHLHWDQNYVVPVP